MNILAGVAAFLLIVTRGFLLWLLIPISMLAWVLVHSWAQKSTLGQTVCWYDWNLIAFLMLVPFRPAMRYSVGKERVRFLRASEMRHMEPYRIEFTHLN